MTFGSLPEGWFKQLSVTMCPESGWESDNLEGDLVEFSDEPRADNLDFWAGDVATPSLDKLLVVAPIAGSEQPMSAWTGVAAATVDEGLPVAP